MAISNEGRRKKRAKAVFGNGDAAFKKEPRKRSLEKGHFTVDGQLSTRSGCKRVINKGVSASANSPWAIGFLPSAFLSTKRFEAETADAILVPISQYKYPDDHEKTLGPRLALRPRGIPIALRKGHDEAHRLDIDETRAFGQGARRKRRRSFSLVRPGSPPGSKKQSGEDRPCRKAQQERDRCHPRQTEEAADDHAGHARKGEKGKGQHRRQTPSVPPQASAGQRQGQSERSGPEGGQEHFADHRLPKKLGAETNEALKDQSDRQPRKRTDQK